MAPSVVWNYYEKIKNGTAVKCGRCGKELRYNNSTTTLASHLKTAHKLLLALQPSSGSKAKAKSAENQEESDVDDPTEDNAQTQAPVATVGNAERERAAPVQQAQARPRPAANAGPSGPMDRCLNNVSSFSAGGSRDAACNNALLYMIAADNMPLRTPERKGFRMFCKTLQPLFNLPSEPTVTKRLVAKYEDLQKIVKAGIAAAESYCLTADIWTHKSTMRSYLGVTIHYREGKDIVGVELCCKELHDRKNIPNLRLALREVCAEWGILYEKISAVLTDGGANIKGAVREEFGVSKHVTCVAHLINGVGQAAIGLHKYEVPSMADNVAEIPENEEDLEDVDEPPEGTPDNGTCLKTLLWKVKRIVRFFRQSEIANSELLKLQNEAGTPEHLCLRLIQEVCTRWNSCYEMLDRFLHLADFISRVLLKLQRERSSRAKPPNFPTGEELEALAEAKELLKPLYQMTLEVSKEKIVTLSKCIPLVATLRSKVRGFEAVTPIGFNLKETLITEIQTKFSGVEFLKPYAAATLLDPRFKREGFPPAGPNAVAAVANAVTHVGGLVAAEIDKSAAALQESLEQQAQARAREGPPPEEDSFWSDFDTTVQSRAPQAGHDVAGGLPVEFRQYLNGAPINRKDNPNPLCAWQAMKGEYPHVYTVAMRYLTIMATSVPAERLFSHAGLIATQLRNRLSGKHLNMLVFMRSLPEKLWFL